MYTTKTTSINQSNHRYVHNHPIQDFILSKALLMTPAMLLVVIGVAENIPSIECIFQRNKTGGVAVGKKKQAAQQQTFGFNVINLFANQVILLPLLSLID